MSLYNFGSRLSQPSTNTSARRLNELPETASNQQVLSQSSNTSEKASEAIAELRTRLEEITKIFNDVVFKLSRLKDIGINSEVVNKIINSATELLKQRIEERLNDLAQENNGAGALGNSNQNSGGATQDSSDDASDSNQPSPIQDVTPEPITSPITQPPVSQPPVDATPVTPVAPVAPVTPPAANSSSSSSNSIDMGLLGNLLNNQNQGQSQGQNNNSGNASNNTGSSNSQAGSNQNSNGGANSQSGNSGNTSSNSNTNSSQNNQGNSARSSTVDPALLLKYLQNEDIDYSMYGNKVTRKIDDLLKDLKIDSFYKVSDHGATGEDLINDPGGYKYWNPHEEISNLHLVIKIPKLSSGEKVKLVDYQGFNAPFGIPQNFKYEVVEYKGSHFLMIPNEPGGFSDMLGSGASAFLKFASTSGKTFGVEVVGIAALCNNSTFRTPDFITLKATGGVVKAHLTSNDAVNEQVYEEMGGSYISKIINVKLYNSLGQMVKDYSSSSSLPNFLKISADKKSLDIDTNNVELKGLINQHGIVDIKFNQSCDLFSHDTRTTGKVRVIKAENYDQIFKSIQKGDSSEFTPSQTSTMSVDILNFDDEEVSASNDNSNQQQEIANIFEDNNQHSNSHNDDMNYNSSQEYNCCNEVVSNSPQTYELFNFGEYYS